MTHPAAPAPYLPFDDGRFRLMMGLMPLPLAEWIELDEELADELAAKRKLLTTRHDEVFVALPEAEAPAAELLALLAEHLVQHHPTSFAWDGGQLLNKVTGDRWDLAGRALHPLDVAGRLVQEDFCLLEARGEAQVLVAGSLCSPARWRLRDKIGHPLREIHAPVPGYDATLGRPVDRFLTLLKPERPVWRLNWGVMDDPDAFQPAARAAPCPITDDTAGERLWLRVERQTLRRLRSTGAVVFTIRTHVTRLDAAIRTAGSAATLAAAIRDMPDAMSDYKRIAPVAPALLAWLDRVAEG
jgi:hypothetical protein